MSSNYHYPSHILNGKNVEKAYEIVKKYAHITPILTCQTLNDISHSSLFFKCENYQKVGAFKFRGACHSVYKFLENDKSIESVCTHSSGNHAQAVALAAKMNKIQAHIVMPKGALECKVNAVRGYGGNVIFSENNPLSRETKCEEVKEKYKSCFIHPSNEPQVILGAGTAFLEFWKQMNNDYKTKLDAVLVPIGGGGLASGCALAAKGKCKIYGAEPLAANDAYRSFKKGKLLLNPPGKPKTIADGLLTNLGSNTYQIIKSHFEDIFTVNDEEILKAMKLVWERMKIIIEPSSAVPVAVALFNKNFKKLKLKNVGVVLSGGNIDLSSFFELMKKKCNQ